jgi:ABC-2 type transport system ATP-binding protein
MTVPPLVIDGLRAAFGRREVLRGITLAMRPGEVFGLVGLNGAGKTTLIRTLLDLNPGTAGTIRLFGASHREPAARTNLLYLPEKYQPSPHLTGWEHLRLSRRWSGAALDRPAAVAMAKALAFDPPALDRRVRTYSKGMGQKLGLMAALLGTEPLLILDEPMSGLDPRARVRLKDQIAATRNGGRSIFLSSHILADMEEICDRIGILHDGRLLHVGPPAEVVATWGGGTLERAFLAAIDAAEPPSVP